MRRITYSTLLLAVMAGTAASHAATVFNDTFGSSTLNAATPAAPTGASTAYAVLSTKNATGSSIAASALNLIFPITTSGFAEAQALFSTTPLTLAINNHYVQLRATFTALDGILEGPGTGSYLAMGLFDSGGTGPVTGGALANGGLTATAGSPYATGYAQNWVGYAGRIRENTGSSRIATRPAQTGSGTASANQDVIFGGETAGYNNPAAVAFGTTYNWGQSLLQNAQYTATFKITLDDSGTGAMTIVENLYSGTDTSGTPLFSLTRSGTAIGDKEFDAFAFGYRCAEASPGTASSITISQFEITSNVVPEPGSVSLLLLGIGSIALFRRKN